MATPVMHKMAYPIETEDAYRFWASRHKCNRAKAIIAFSEDLNDANQNLRRHGFQFHLRRRALQAYGAYVAIPSMMNIPFSPAAIPWWECMPDTPLPPPTPGKWAVWVDDEFWVDTSEWKEWIPDAVEEEVTP